MIGQPNHFNLSFIRKNHLKLIFLNTGKKITGPDPSNPARRAALVRAAVVKAFHFLVIRQRAVVNAIILDACVLESNVAQDVRPQSGIGDEIDLDVADQPRVEVANVVHALAPERDPECSQTGNLCPLTIHDLAINPF